MAHLLHKNKIEQRQVKRKREEGLAEMGQRERKLLWLRDTLEQLMRTQQQLTWTEDCETVRLLTDKMLRDLECCRKLCVDLHEKTTTRQSA